MNGMEKITARLAEDAKGELDKIAADTKAQIDEIKSNAEAQAKEISEDILARGKKQAQERGERLASSAQMEQRKMELGVKQEVIGEAFDRALTDLCSRPEKEYVDLLVSLVLSSVSSGKETLIFSEKDKDKVGTQVVERVNEALSQGKAPELPPVITESKAGALLEKMVQKVAALVAPEGASGLTLSSETRPLAGGFIMLDGDVEINCDFDTLVRLQRNSLELEVANLLF